MTAKAPSSVEAEGSLRRREGHKYGGSPEGIRHHYDGSNEFWRLVLGSTYAYSCALFEGSQDDLDAAQRAKIAWHLKASGVASAKAVLDIGCGWGSVLRPLSDLPGVEKAVGLTLSDAQADHLRGQALPRVSVQVENWANHEPAAPYDSIISIGAFEHFANPKQTPAEKILVYRDFFQRCRQWLAPRGRMSLQTIAFGNMKREDASDFMNSDIFPDSDLPFLSEIVAALDGIFEVVAFRNDRLHYARTYGHWASNLRRHREHAVALVGEDEVRRQERHFKLAAMGYRMGKQYLLRFALRPLTDSWAITGSDDVSFEPASTGH